MMLLLACARVDYDVVDLQINIETAIPAGAEIMRVCVDEQLIHEEGAGNGRVAVPGLWSDRPAVVTVEITDEVGTELGQAGPVTLDADLPNQLVEWAGADGVPCETTEDPAPDSADTWLLGIRFLDEPFVW